MKTDALAKLEAVADPEIQRRVMQVLGRRGGLKGGKARAANLSPERRREIAKQAAAKRWASKQNNKGSQAGD